MFGIGLPEVAVILVVALLVLGPQRLPEIARALGKGLAEFRRLTSDVNREISTARDIIEGEARQHERTRREDERRRQIAEAAERAMAARTAAGTDDVGGTAIATPSTLTMTAGEGAAPEDVGAAPALPSTAAATAPTATVAKAASAVEPPETA